MSISKDEIKEIAKLQKLRTLLIDNFIALAANAELTPTDRRTIVTLLKDSGMNVDPNDLPQPLREKLSKSIPIDEGLEEDEAL
jgi:hypothetical protein